MYRVATGARMATPSVALGGPSLSQSRGTPAADEPGSSPIASTDDRTKHHLKSCPPRSVPTSVVEVVGDELGAGRLGEVGVGAACQPFHKLGGFGDGVGTGAGGGVAAAAGFLPSDPLVAAGTGGRVGAHPIVELEDVSADGHVWRRVVRRGHTSGRGGKWGKSHPPLWETLAKPLVSAPLPSDSRQEPSAYGSEGWGFRGPSERAA